MMGGKKFCKVKEHLLLAEAYCITCQTWWVMDVHVQLPVELGYWCL